MTDQPTDQKDHERLAAERVASAWRWDPDLERLAADRGLLATLPPAKRIALGHYEVGKAAAAAIGVDVTDPKGTA